MRAVTLIAVLAGLGGCRSDAQAVPAGPGSGFKPDRMAELFFTTGLAGYIEPCGCTSNPLGGLPRMATVVGRSKVDHALVDAGQLLLPTEAIEDLARPQHRAKAHLLARAFRKMNVAAFNLSPSDLVEGTGFLAELQKEGAVPWVSSNVRPRSDRGPEVARSYLRVLGGIRWGITGVAIPERIAETSDDFAALELVPAVETEVETLREDGAEVVVVLGHLPPADAAELARAVPGIDVLIRSPGTPIERPPNPPERVGSVVIVEAGQQGQYLGRLRVGLASSRAVRPLLLDDAGAHAAAERARLERKIAALDKEIARFGAIPGQEAARAARSKVRDRLAARRAAIVPRASTPEGPYLSVNIVPLDTSVPNDDGMRSLIVAYDQALREMNAKRGDPSACVAEEGAPRYVGSKACSGCHPQASALWATTAHSRAWATLEEKGKDFDLTCVGCHSVGYREPGGYCSLSEVAMYRNVGCENCHGPGSAHIAAPTEGHIDRARTERTCTRGCHVPEHSDAFVYESYVQKILGAGHGR
ncbi:MAG: UshA-like (seleno)protein, partial [Myxococcota bacterium]